MKSVHRTHLPVQVVLSRAFRQLTQLLANCVRAAILLGAFCTTGAAAQTAIEIANFHEVDSTGEKDSSAGIARAVADGGRKVIFPCGVFLIGQAVRLPSHTEIAGAGPCTVLKLTENIQGNNNWADMPALRRGRTMPSNIFTNADFLRGNEDIKIHDFVLDGSSGTGGRTIVHLLAFYKLKGAVIERLTFIGSGTSDIQDGVAFIASSNYVVANNYVFDVWNACFDQWDGSHDFKIEKNFCDGNGKAHGGIFVNGLDSMHASKTTYNGSIVANVILRVQNAGVYVAGLWNESKITPTYGVVRNINVERNIIKEVSAFHGIIISDGDGITVTSNKVLHVAHQGIRVGSQFRGATSSILVKDNLIEDASRAPVKDDAIRVTNEARNVTISGNVVGPGAHGCAIGIDANVSDARISYETGIMYAGSTGELCDRRVGGAATQ
jgi:hypothetical protein